MRGCIKRRVQKGGGAETEKGGEEENLQQFQLRILPILFYLVHSSVHDSPLAVEQSTSIIQR